MHVCNKGFVQNCTIVSNATTPDNSEGGGHGFAGAQLAEPE